MIRPMMARILIEENQNSDSPYQLTTKMLRAIMTARKMVIQTATGLYHASKVNNAWGSATREAPTYTGLLQ
jgi:hypothetical protein